MRTPVEHSKLFSRIAFGIIGLAIVSLLYISYLLLAPVDVLTVKEPLPASPTEVDSGDVVNLMIDYCKHKHLESHITIDYIGPAVVPSLSTVRDFPLGCHKQILPISIPDAVPTGQYTLHMEIKYQVNPLSVRTYRFDSVVIDVSHREPQNVTVSPKAN